jgi:MFS family permease
VSIGLVMRPNAITQLIFSPLGGRWGQRIGHSKILVIGFVVAALGLFMLSALRTSQLGIVASVTVFGSGLGLATVGNTNVLSGSCTRETFGSATAINSTILTIGMSTGPVLAGLVIGSFADPSTGYSISWVVAAVISLAAIGIVLMNKLDLRANVQRSSMEDRS